MGVAYLLGIVVGSWITSALLYLPFSGLLGRFFIPGVMGILFGLLLVIPGALVAGLLAHSSAGGALAGAVTGLLGNLNLLINVPALGPPIELVASNTLLPLPVALTVGWMAGYTRRKFRLRHHPIINPLILSLAVIFYYVIPLLLPS